MTFSRRLRNRVTTGAVVLTLAAVSIGVSAGPTGAATDVVSGTLAASDPTTSLVNPNLNACGSVLPVTVHYDEVPFEAPESGTFNFMVTVGAEITSMYLYQGSWDPANPLVNCIRASNGDVPEFNANLVGGHSYTLVIVDATEEQTGGAWTVQATFGGLGGTPPTDSPPGSDPAGSATPVTLDPNFTG